MTAMTTSSASHCSCCCVGWHRGRRVAYLERQRLHCVVLSPVIPSVLTQIDVPGGGQQSPEPLQHTKQYEKDFTLYVYV